MSLSDPATPCRIRPAAVFARDCVAAPAMRRVRDGSIMRWGEADTPGPPSLVAPGTPAAVTVAVSPVRPGHSVTVDYRVIGGAIRQAVAQASQRSGAASERMFRAVLPGQPGGVVEFLPVLRFAGQPISPRLEESAESSRYRIGGVATPAGTTGNATSRGAAPEGQSRWAWGSKFLGAVTAKLRKEVIGPTPDGLRINWHVQEGVFVGPGFAATVLPGATDWLRIRKDGVGIVSVQASFETRTGTRIFGCYGGYFDLGPDGYARALRDDFDPLPPIVVTPTYATADPQLEWLNRARCIGLGRVDMSALLVEFDVYVVQVGDRQTKIAKPVEECQA